MFVTVAAPTGAVAGTADGQPHPRGVPPPPGGAHQKVRPRRAVLVLGRYSPRVQTVGG